MKRHNNSFLFARCARRTSASLRSAESAEAGRYMAAMNKGLALFKKPSVKTSSFSGEFFAWRHRVDDIGVLRLESRVDCSIRLRGQGSASTLSMEEC